MPIIEGRLSGIRFGREMPEGDVSFSSYELLDALVNGLVFHGDTEHAKSIVELRDCEPWQYMWVVLTEIISPVYNSATWLVAVIRMEKRLPEDEFPARGADRPAAHP